MASAAEEGLEYESDPEEAKRSLTMRRREASDEEEEEEEEGDGDERERPVRRIDPRDEIRSDGELDGQGAPEEYYDEESEIEEEELSEEDEEEEEEVVEEEEYEVSVGKAVEGSDEVEHVAAAAVDGGGVVGKQLDEGRERSVEESKELQGVDQVEEEEKKENEPFAVPTAGAFYMHDDRFRDKAGGRNRRTLGGRKLWESKDDKKWGHDKFEEMTLQDRHYEEGMRNSRGYRARGKNRGEDRGYPRGNKPRAYNNNNQNQGPKGVRGRGPRRYEPSWNNNNVEAPPTQQRHGSGKSSEKKSHTTGRAPSATATSNVEPDPVPARKQMFGSSLSSASPPFYPSGSSNKEITLAQKRDVQAGTINRNLRSPVMDENFSKPQSSTMMRGKNVVGSSGMENQYINDSISPNARKHSSVLQLPPSGSSLVSTTQPLQPRAHGRDLASSGQMIFQPGAPHNQVSRASPPPQLHDTQRSHAQGRVQPSLQASVQQLGQRPGSGSQTSSPPKAALSIKSFESGEMDSPSESSKLKTALVEKGKGGVQIGARNSFLYGGAQIMGASGNMGGGHGDQNFGATPAFLPVMPFGSQHPGGIGVPAVGMAFPGYVAQPQLGLGNSEMTWLPVLAGAAGALGAAYCSPYISADGAYHSRPSGQTSSTGASSKESNSNKPSNEWKPSQRPEVASDEFGQRQKNTRRYTEMNFSQKYLDR
ncbi:protein MLN51 homolog [Actinidia eriantha]|uniref:protein MLN51 homolog n=1 Tax=Actinidia eriantha TaxID=165200 RepID=UPI0025902CA3|nr:protein MLN51 homolog [Actinidia eriantha]XP_057504998.1 protein MLN51 homolog [Actinidia eriantha]